MAASGKAGGAAYRLAVASRAVAAVFGGYALAALCTIFLSRVLPLPVADAVLAATMLSFIVYALAVIWVFATATAVRAWAGLAAGALPMAAAVWLLA